MSEVGPIRVVRAGDIFVRGVLRPFRSMYKIEGSGVFHDIPGRGKVEINYAGTPVARLRQIARRLAREQGPLVLDLTRKR